MIIRPFVDADGSAVTTVLRRAFSGPPWNESWDQPKVDRMWKDHSMRPGFDCLVADRDGRVVAATWYDTPSDEDLARERGTELSNFVRSHGAEGSVVWIRETVCDPDVQGTGLAGRLKEAALARLKDRFLGCLLLTRMRDDNVAIVRINRRLGFEKTGVRVAFQNIPGLVHDYWYLRL